MSALDGPIALVPGSDLAGWLAAEDRGVTPTELDRSELVFPAAGDLG